jgi:hypothetical protein
MTERATLVTSLIAFLGLAGLPAGPVLAQTRVVVPIVIQAPRVASPQAAPTSVQITTRTVSPRTGGTRTEVTVQDTTGVRGFSRVSPSAPPSGETRVTVQDTTGVHGFSRVSRSAPPSGETRVTVQDTTGVRGFSSRRPGVLSPDATTTQVTVQDTTGVQGFSSVRSSPLPGATMTPGQLHAAGDAGSTVVVPFPVTLRPVTAGSLQSLTIRTEGPIDAPIVILAP